jgi:hypothetical protein
MRLAPEFARRSGARIALAPPLPRRRSLSPPQGRESGHGPVAGARPARLRAPRAGARALPRRRPRAPPPRSRPARQSAGRERPPARNSATASRSQAPVSRPARAWRAAARSGRIREERPTSAWRAIGPRLAQRPRPRKLTIPHVHINILIYFPIFLFAYLQMIIC